MARRHVSLTFLLAALAALALAGDAVAHDPIEEAFARGERPPDWVSSAVAWAALAVFVGSSALSLRRWLRPAASARLRHAPLVAQLLSLWILLGHLQSRTATTIGTPPLLLDFGYVVLPLALGGVWLFVVANFGGTLRAVLAERGPRAVAIGTALAFAAFYLWSSNVVGVPEPDELPPAGELDGFVILFSAYGPLAVWPNVEFWIPQLTLFGAVSLGVAMVVATAAALMGLNWAATIYSLRVRRRGAGLGAGVGGLAALGTNFCCCCAPALYPVMALVLGSTTASSIGAWLLGSASPFYNLSQVAVIALLLAAMAALHRRLGIAPPPRQAPGSTASRTRAR